MFSTLKQLFLKIPKLPQVRVFPLRGSHSSPRPIPSVIATDERQSLFCLPLAAGSTYEEHVEGCAATATDVRSSEPHTINMSKKSGEKKAGVRAARPRQSKRPHHPPPRPPTSSRSPRQPFPPPLMSLARLLRPLPPTLPLLLLPLARQQPRLLSLPQRLSPTARSAASLQRARARAAA